MKPLEGVHMMAQLMRLLAYDQLITAIEGVGIGEDGRSVVSYEASVSFGHIVRNAEF